MHENRLDIAERMLKPHLKEDPFDVRAIRMLAELAARIGRLKDSETLLRRALEIAPELHAGASQSRDGARPAGPGGGSARASRRHFRGRAGTTRAISNLKAATLARLGDFDQAHRAVRAGAGASPEPAPGAAQLWPHAQDHRAAGGRRSPLIARRSRCNPALGEAWWSLANLKTVRFSEADIAAMEQALERRRPQGR